MELIKELAQFVCTTHFKNIPQHIVAKAKECFLDWQGVALDGKKVPTTISLCVKNSYPTLRRDYQVFWK